MHLDQTRVPMYRRLAFQMVWLKEPWTHCPPPLVRETRTDQP